MRLKKAAAIRAVIAVVAMVAVTRNGVVSAAGNVLVRVKVRNCPIKVKIVHHVVNKAAIRTVKRR